jgi:VIT1/CCC1 family predicted Fe2+/Mn2+ transporter
MFAFSTKPRISLGNGFLGNLIDPIDRLSETIFSILIFLTFTLAFKIFWVTDPLEQPISSEIVDELLKGALGAILAWGIIDGIMYALFSLFARGERHRLLNDIQAAGSEQEAVEVIAADMDHLLDPISGENERKALYSSIYIHLRDSKPRNIGFKGDDFTGALGHVFVAIIAVIPSLVPLLALRHDYDLAIRISIIVSFIVLFVVGFRWGIYTGANPWKIGLLLMSVALALVLIAILLGG